MSDPVQTLAGAQADAAAARARAAASLGRVQAKLDPKRIARRAVRDVTDAGASAAEVGVDTARRYPAALVSLVAAAGLFLARHRIAHLVRKARGATGTRDAS